MLIYFSADIGHGFAALRDSAESHAASISCQWGNMMFRWTKRVAKGLNMPETTSLTDRFCDQLVESSSRHIKVGRSLTVVEEWKTKQHHQNVISFDIKVKTALYIKNWLLFIKSIPTLEPFAKYSLRYHGETKSRKEVQLTIVIKSILSPWDGIN